MKKLRILLLLVFVFLPINIVTANENISGTWQGQIAIAPDTELTVQFIINQAPDGSYAAVFNTPDNVNFKNIEANGVEYNAGSLKIDVAELSGTYKGTVKGKKIEGEWEQEGTSFPLILKPYEKPTLSKEDMEMLLGTWLVKSVKVSGTLQGIPDPPEGISDMPEGKSEMHEANIGAFEAPTELYRFKMSEQGEFTGTLSLPEMGIENPLTDMGVSDGIFTFKIGEMSKFKGKLTEKEIVGDLMDTGLPDGRGMVQSITLMKGEYKAPVYSLDLPKEIKEQLIGKWRGMFTMLSISSDVVFRFEISKDGDFLGYVDIPELETSGLPIKEANMSDGFLSLKVNLLVPEGVFTGKISADKIDGEYKIPGNIIISASSMEGENMSDESDVIGVRMEATRKVLEPGSESDFEGKISPPPQMNGGNLKELSNAVPLVLTKE